MGSGGRGRGDLGLLQPLGARGLTCSEILLLALLAQALLLGVQEPMLVTSDKKALNPRTRFVAIANCHVAWGKPLGIYPYCHARAIIQHRLECYHYVVMS